MRATVVTWQRKVPASVSMCQKRTNFSFLRAKRAIRRANFLTWRAHIPKSMPIFQIFLLGNAKGNFYTLLLHEKFYFILDIIYIQIMCICMVHENFIRFHLYTSWYHLQEICMEFLLFETFLLFSYKWKYKNPGFYTVQVTKVFSDFSQLKQLNKIKNTCEYYGLLELRSAWFGDAR